MAVSGRHTVTRRPVKPGRGGGRARIDEPLTSFRVQHCDRTRPPLGQVPLPRNPAVGCPGAGGRSPWLSWPWCLVHQAAASVDSSAVGCPRGPEMRANRAGPLALGRRGRCRLFSPVHGASDRHPAPAMRSTSRARTASLTARDPFRLRRTLLHRGPSRSRGLQKLTAHRGPRPDRARRGQIVTLRRPQARAVPAVRRPTAFATRRGTTIRRATTPTESRHPCPTSGNAVITPGRTAASRRSPSPAPWVDCASC
jgi:hypothetical protein